TTVTVRRFKWRTQSKDAGMANSSTIKRDFFFALMNTLYKARSSIREANSIQGSASSGNPQLMACSQTSFNIVIVGKERKLSRRRVLKSLAGAISAPFSTALSGLAQSRLLNAAQNVAPGPRHKGPKPASPFSPEDDQLLEDLERAQCCYFWEQAN